MMQMENTGSPGSSARRGKRPSDTTVLHASSGATSSSSSSSSSAPSSRLVVRVKSWHAVASWSWGTGADDVCGICQTSYEGCAPGVKFPGDECPVVWGKCAHAFHLQCVSAWLASGKTTCPICRREWEFGEREAKPAGEAP